MPGWNIVLGQNDHSDEIADKIYRTQPNVPSPPALVVHGVSATCKSTVIRGVLSTLGVPHAVVRSTECITGRHLLTKILWNTLEALGQEHEWEKYGKGRCEHVSSLAVLLEECLAARAAEKRGKFVLVLDEIDRQREAPHTLLSALARVGEIVSFWLGIPSCVPWSLIQICIDSPADTITLCRSRAQLDSSTTVSPERSGTPYQLSSIYA